MTHQALKKEKIRQLENEMKYAEYYIIHVLKKVIDEKNEKVLRIVPVQKCVESQLPRVKLICIADIRSRH